MKALISFVIVALIGLSSCDKALEKSYQRDVERATEEKLKRAEADLWYSSWVSEADGQIFHSEITLEPSEVKVIQFSSTEPVEIGFVVQKGYEISKAGTFVYMGTEDAPHAVGSSAGSWKLFEPTDGMIKLRFENGSGISTKLAVYTKK